MTAKAPDPLPVVCCAECAQWQADTINPAQGVGTCVTRAWPSSRPAFYTLPPWPLPPYPRAERQCPEFISCDAPAPGGDANATTALRAGDAEAQGVPGKRVLPATPDAGTKGRDGLVGSSARSY